MLHLNKDPRLLLAFIVRGDERRVSPPGTSNEKSKYGNTIKGSDEQFLADRNVGFVSFFHFNMIFQL